MKNKVIQKILFLFLVAFFSMISFSQLSTQNYYYNINEVSTYKYYKDIEVNENGTLLLNGLYDNTLGEFLFSINSQNVYKVGYDKSGELVKYYRRLSEYYPKFTTKNGSVKEILVTNPGANNDQLRVYEYNSGKLVKQDVYRKGLDRDGISVKMTREQIVAYYYDQQYRLIREVYQSYSSELSKSIVNTYSGSSLSKKEIFDGDGILEYYYTYSGNKIKHHKPDGDVVREYVTENNGDFTIEYYPPIGKYEGGRYMQSAVDKYPQGVKVGFYTANGLIYRYSRILPEKNGFKIADCKAMKLDNDNVVVENTSYTRAFVWKESTTLIQKVYLILPSTDKSLIREFPFTWIDKKGTDLLGGVPKSVKSYLERKSTDFIGAESIIIGQIVEPSDGVPNMIAEVYNNKGERGWCDVYESYVVFIVSLKDSVDQNYNKLVIRAKGYGDYTKSFEMKSGDRIVNIGEIYLRKE